MKAKKMKLLAYLAAQKDSVTFGGIPEEIRNRFDPEGPDNLHLVLERLCRDKVIQSGPVGCWQLTAKGHLELEQYRKSRYQIYYRAVLHYLADYCHNFVPVSQVLQQLDLADEDGTMAAMIEKKLVKKGLVFTFSENGVLINDLGRQLAAQQRQGWKEKSIMEQHYGTFIPGAAAAYSSFSMQEEGAGTDPASSSLRPQPSGLFTRVLDRFLGLLSRQPRISSRHEATFWG